MNNKGLDIFDLYNKFVNKSSKSGICTEEEKLEIMKRHASAQVDLMINETKTRVLI